MNLWARWCHYRCSCVQDEGRKRCIIVCRSFVCIVLFVVAWCRVSIAKSMIFASMRFSLLRSRSYSRHQSYPSFSCNRRRKFKGRERRRVQENSKTPSSLLSSSLIAHGSCYAILYCRVVASSHEPLFSSFICSSSPCRCATALLKARTTSSGTVSQSKLLV